MQVQELETLTTEKIRQLIAEVNGVLVEKFVDNPVCANLGELTIEGLRQQVADAHTVLAERCVSKPPQTPDAFVDQNHGGSTSSGNLFVFGDNSASSVSNGPLDFGPGGIFGNTGESRFNLPGAGNNRPFFSTGSGLFASLGSSGLGAGSTRVGLPTQSAAEDDDENQLPEKEVTSVPGWRPSITLEVLDNVETGEENETEVYKQRAKLFRFVDGEWKERGHGDAKLLKHSSTDRVRFLLRQEKTGKVAANHYVIETLPYCDLKFSIDSKTIWVWSAPDFADENLVTERFALKFATEDLAGEFSVAWAEAKLANREAIGTTVGPN